MIGTVIPQKHLERDFARVAERSISGEVQAIVRVDHHSSELSCSCLDDSDEPFHVLVVDKENLTFYLSRNTLC